MRRPNVPQGIPEIPAVTLPAASAGLCEGAVPDVRRFAPRRAAGKTGWGVGKGGGDRAGPRSSRYGVAAEVTVGAVGGVGAPGVVAVGEFGCAGGGRRPFGGAPAPSQSSRRT